MRDSNNTRGNDEQPFERREHEGQPLESREHDGWPSERRPDYEGQPVERRESSGWPSERRGYEAQPVERRESTTPAYSTPPLQQPAPQPVHHPQRSNLLIPLLVGALLCLGLGGLLGWQIGKGSATTTTNVSPGGPTTYKAGGMTREQVIAKVRPAVVQINVQRGQGGGLGSGEIIDQQGHIVTNYHVIADGQQFQVVLFDGTTLPAQLTGVDPGDDLAVVKVNPPRHLFAIPIGDSSQLQVGNDVLAIGNPLGITQTVTSGIVSALGRNIPEGAGGANIIDAVQTDAAINPGNSGGALVNMNGELIGIPTLVPLDPEFKTPANGVGFAIPSNRVKFIVPQLIQNGKVIHSGRPSLGTTVASVDPAVAAAAGLSVDRGVLIVKVAPNGPASQAGLRPGDVITRVNNSSVNNTSDLTDALVHLDPGTTVTLTIMRGSQEMQIRVKLGEMKFQQ